MKKSFNIQNFTIFRAKGENCEINSIKISNKLQKIGFRRGKKSVEPSILKPRQLKHVELDEDILDEVFLRYILLCSGNFWVMGNDRLV